jgi:hypothetical protein
VGSEKILKRVLTPRLTGAEGPIGPQGTNSGQENAEGMPAVCVRVEPTVGHIQRIRSIQLRLKRFALMERAPLVLQPP